MKNKRHHKLENTLEQVFYSLFRQWIAVSCIYYYYLDITNLLLCMVGDFDFNQGIIYSKETNFYIKIFNPLAWVRRQQTIKVNKASPTILFYLIIWYMYEIFF